MYWYVLVVVCTGIYWYIPVLVRTGMYMHVHVCNGIYSFVYLWVHTMKAPLWQLERVASGMHYALELLRLPLDTATTGTYLSDCPGSIASSLCEPRKPNLQ